MDELLSLKWKHHCSTFLQILKLIRKEQLYTDVTLACGGKYYNVHRMVLTACSAYFQEIFEQTDSNKPIIILNGINCEDLEGILDYMYIGEVNVEQSDLSSLIKAAEYLQIKGLAVADEESFPKKYSSKYTMRNTENRRKRKINEITSPSSVLHKAFKRDKYIQSNISHDLENTTPKKELSDNNVIKTEIIDDVPPLDDIFITEDNVDSKINMCKEDILNPQDFSDHIAGGSNNLIETNEMNDASEFQDLSLDWQGNDSYSIIEQESDHSAVASSVNMRRWKCNHCDKKLHSPSNLRRHLRIHTGEKPFSCSLCTHQTNDKANLKRHMICVHQVFEKINPVSL